MTGHHLEVVPLSRHRWVVRYEGDPTPLSESPTLMDALAEARNHARQFGETVIHGAHQHRAFAHDLDIIRRRYFPAALDDGITVYKNAIKTTDPKNIAIFGSSAGGALTLEMILKAEHDGLPLPGAIAPGTPMSDVTKVGDTFVTNAMLDNVLVSPDGFCDAGTKVYANGHDLKDPLLSPVYGDMQGFPPTILTSGTRDLLLSNTVRVRRKLRQAGVDAMLQVYEGQSHAQFYRDDTAPEAKEAFEEIAGFFDKHLEK